MQTWTRRWTIEVPGKVAGPVWHDEETGSVFIADGWGVSFASLAVRRFNLASGEELAFGRTRTSIRAFAVAGRGEVYLLGEKAIFVHHRRTLERTAAFRRRVPRLASVICAVNESTVAIGAPNRLLEYETSTGRSRSVSRTPAIALARISETVVALLADGSILRRGAEGWEEVGGLDEACYVASVDRATSRIAALAGRLDSAYDESGTPKPAVWPRSRRLHVLDLHAPDRPRSVELPFPAGNAHLIGDQVVVVDWTGYESCLGVVDAVTPGSPIQRVTLPARVIASAGPLGLLGEHPGQREASVSISLFAPPVGSRQP